MSVQTTHGVWELFSQPLRSYIRKRVVEPDEAEDILQEVFLKIHTRLHTLRDEEKLPAWLYKIARNAINDHYRSRQDSEGLADSIPVGYEGEGADAGAQLASQMRYYVNACLPEKYAYALWLADLEGRTQQEVAETLGLTLSGAKARVQRARRMLREAFLRCCYFEFDGRKRVIYYAPREDQGCGCGAQSVKSE
ncbi:MAG TPA: RNA polymerase sigma factor SigZ [Blastocatellia bacterium]|nr:RNA polymerase sigma factor SigZ [Blastocatellia bacterium]